MPVYNCEQFLRASIQSILSQTYTNFEFIIINDGSIDKSEDIILNYQKTDNRIIYLFHENQGITKSLNIGIKKSKGKYIVRMDADDISHPKRFESQLEYLDVHSNVDIIGSQVSLIDEENKIIRDIDNLPLEDCLIKWDLIFGTPLYHPTLMIRKTVFEKYGYYDEVIYFAQDIEFLRRASHKSQFNNLPIKLLQLRIHNDSISSKYTVDQENIRIQSLVQYVNTITGMGYKTSEIHLLFKLIKNGINNFSQFLLFSNVLNHLRKTFINNLCHSNSNKKRIKTNISSLYYKSAIKTAYSNLPLSIFMIIISMLFNYKMITNKKIWWHMKRGFLVNILVKPN